MPVRVSATVLLLATASTGSTPPKAPVQWHIKTAPAKPLKRGANFDVTITGQLDPGWHLYALQEPEGGPIATEVAIAEGDPADLLRVDEGKPRVVPDPLFQKPTRFFEGSADFTLHLQAARDAHAGPTGLHILVRYQSCNDRVCLPPRTDTVAVPLSMAP